MTEHAKTGFLHQCSSLTSTVSDITAVFRVRQCSANIKKNCASHDCSASHHCRLVSNLFEIRHAKHRWFLHAKTQKTQTFLHTSHIPLLNWRRPETCKNKNSSTCHAHSSNKHASCRSKTKQGLFGFGCFMRHAKLMNMLRGPFFRHELRPKWPLLVLCYTHRLLSS